MTYQPTYKPLVLALALILAGCQQSPQARSAKFVQQGKNYLQKGDVSRAVLQFRNAAQATPQDPEIYFQLGLAYVAAKDAPMAVAAFRRVLELNPRHMGAQVRIAQMMAATNNPGLWKDANRELAKLLETNPPTTEALRTLATTQLKLGLPGDAVQNLGRAVQQSPQELSSSLMLSQAQLSQGDAKAAEETLKAACAQLPKSAEAYTALGEFYLTQRKLPDAELQLKHALQLDGKYGPAMLDLANLQRLMGRKDEAEQNLKLLSGLSGYKAIYATFLFQEGQHDRAIREFERLAKESPDDRQARTNLILAYRASNRAADAERTLAEALRKNDKDIEALLQRAEIALEKRNYDRAETDLSRVLKLSSTEPEVHYLLAKVNQARGALSIYRQQLTDTLELNPYLQGVRVELAMNLLQAKSAGGRAALDILNAAPEIQKNSLAILAARNWALYALGDFAEMRKGIDEGLARERTPDLLIQDGLWKLRTDPVKARASIEEALRIDPTDIRGLEALNRTYLAQKNGGLALQKVKEYASQHPDSAPVQDFLGMLLVANGQAAEARKVYSNIRALDPQFVKADFSLIQIDVLEGHLADARKKLEAVLSNDQASVTAQLWLGIVSDSMGDYNAAIEHLQHVVELAPNDAQASNNLAYLLAEHRNQPDIALKYAEKAVELEPKHAAFRDTLGWVLYRKGLYSQAIKHLELAASSPSNVVWKYHLAMAYARGGDVSRSRTTLAGALKINKTVPEAKVAQEIIGTVQ